MCVQYYRRAQRRKPSVGKPKTLSQTSASEVFVHKLSAEINFVWLKQDQCIKLKNQHKLETSCFASLSSLNFLKKKITGQKLKLFRKNNLIRTEKMDVLDRSRILTTTTTTTTVTTP